MTIIEALKKSKKIRKSCNHDNYRDFNAVCGEVVAAFTLRELLADNWEPVLDRKEEIAERWADKAAAKEFHDKPVTMVLVFPFLKEMILGALREYEAGSVESHIKAHERLEKKGD